MIIGTAGHVDHGKTSVVRALTGVDTDRLPEEKARGISIALGYAYVPLADGQVLGFVDVPGHEKFLPTMVAGATGVDFALLVVAADDGPMPQTREHLDILALLGVRTGAVALNKVDAVDGSRANHAAAQVRALLGGTPLEGTPLFAVSARSGQGVPALREHLHAQAAVFRRGLADAHFRLAVDRSFTLAGIGTIVTGTAHSGQVAVGDMVAVAPGGSSYRVRSIHAQDRSSPTGIAGQRCALNLVGLDRNAVQRGDWIVAPEAVVSTARLDACFSLLKDAPRGLRSGSAVHVHLGAAHVPGRIVAIDGVGGAGHALQVQAMQVQAMQAQAMQPGEHRMVQLVLQHPIAAWHGDRFIVRDGAGTRTLGGGRVLDPFAPARYRGTRDRLAALAALDQEDPAERLAAALGQSPQGLDLRRFVLAGNIRAIGPLLEGQGVQRVEGVSGDFALTPEHWRNLRGAALQALDRYHGEHEDEVGPDRARLQRMAFTRVPSPVFTALIADLLVDGAVRASGPWLHLAGRAQAPSAAERALMEMLLPQLAQGGCDPPWVRDLARASGQGESLVRSALLRGAQRGAVYQVVRDLFYHPAAIDRLARHARALHATHGEVRAADFRDATGLGRKRAIQILEFFDRIGLLRREQDRHLVRPDVLPDLGLFDAGSAQGGSQVPIGQAPGEAGGARGGSQIPLEADPPAFPPPAELTSKLPTRAMR